MCAPYLFLIWYIMYPIFVHVIVSPSRRWIFCSHRGCSRFLQQRIPIYLKHPDPRYSCSISAWAWDCIKKWAFQFDPLQHYNEIRFAIVAQDYQPGSWQSTKSPQNLGVAVHPNLPNLTTNISTRNSTWIYVTWCSSISPYLINVNYRCTKVYPYSSVDSNLIVMGPQIIVSPGYFGQYYSH